MKDKLIKKIISIIDLEFDALFYTYVVEEGDLKFIYDNIRKKLKEV